jgi:hypothetical protein
MSCPNKSHPDWKLLVSQVGEKLAFTTWMAYGEIIPENLVKSTAQLQKEIKLPRMIAKDRIQAAYSLIRKYNTKNGTAHTIGQFSKPGDSPYYTRLTVKPNYLPVNIERQRLRDWERSEESISKVADIEEVYGPENFVQTSNKSEQQQIKQGVEELFNFNPELTSIGTPEQYSAYLDTIFPDSKVKDIVYHGSIYDNKKFKDSTRVTGHYFATTPKEALQHAQRQLPNPDDAVLYNILLNIKNPKIITKPIDYEDLDTEAKIYKEDTVFGTDYDSIIAEKVEEYNTTYKTPESTWLEKQIVVFEPEQIHILGSKQDVEGFKEFVGNNSSTNQEVKLAIQSQPDTTGTVGEQLTLDFDEITEEIETQIPIKKESNTINQDVESVKKEKFKQAVAEIRKENVSFDELVAFEVELFDKIFSEYVYLEESIKLKVMESIKKGNENLKCGL